MRLAYILILSAGVVAQANACLSMPINQRDTNITENINVQPDLLVHQKNTHKDNIRKTDVYLLPTNDADYESSKGQVAWDKLMLNLKLKF